jgi:CubicO group peptidase (beta-lactamase class C family)
MMRKSFYILTLFIAFIFSSCTKSGPAENPPAPADTLYFPPLTGSEWQTKSPAAAGWNESQLNSLYDFLEAKHTKAFIILQNGRIVAEKYFGTFVHDSIWYWASAGKSVTAFLIGIAQEKGLLNIGQKTSQYLGTGWTSLPPTKENLITIRHQLTMTTGLNDNVADDDCTDPSCLQYLSDAGTRWAYHNAPYTLLTKVIEQASGQSYNAFFNTHLRSRIGMNGIWITSGYQTILYSNARSMARFGLLILNKGKWSGTPILGDADYFNAMLNSSQAINPAYGYLWWLNGKSQFMMPQTQFVFPGKLVSNAPGDMVAALGKNDQKLYIVPSEKLVVVRMGEPAGTTQLAISSFDNELWGKLKLVIGLQNPANFMISNAHVPAGNTRSRIQQ